MQTQVSGAMPGCGLCVVAGVPFRSRGDERCVPSGWRPEWKAPEGEDPAVRYPDIPKLSNWQADSFALRLGATSPELTALDNLISTYNLARSQMAKNNLIKEIDQA